MTDSPIRPARRRAVLAAGAAALLAGCAGCSEYGDEEGDSRPAPPAEPSGGASGSPAGEEIARTDDVPVGGGTVLKERKIVVTQPEAGRFRAFSAVCTHAGCTVDSVSGGTINCPCHGSKYRLDDASVAGGPAPRPLPPERITVSGNSIRRA
ncbi:Rieske (2Fe-2S) protein [Streptomyces sp. NPDC059785]|uniref:Rieske (2Fe-2S) protein n=1 Tax=unclassified Streptomyces TaxID=2593676 RepID=UPI003654C2D3